MERIRGISQLLTVGRSVSISQSLLAAALQHGISLGYRQFLRSPHTFFVQGYCLSCSGENVIVLEDLAQFSPSADWSAHQCL
jgi:hypothetical protein